jgi:hypothetical protein
MKLRWKCKVCHQAGWDPINANLRSFWQHWRAWHGGAGVWVGTAPRSMFDGVMGR